MTDTPIRRPHVELVDAPPAAAVQLRFHRPTAAEILSLTKEDAPLTVEVVVAMPWRLDSREPGDPVALGSVVEVAAWLKARGYTYQPGTQAIWRVA